MTQTREVSGVSIIILRVLVSGIFIIAGISHLLKPQGIAGRMSNSPMVDFISLFGSLEFIAIASGILMLISGFLFAIGFYTRWNAWVLLILLIPITISVQVPDGFLHGPLWKNIAIAGGLLFFILNKRL